MSEYYPHEFVVVKISTKEFGTHYRVFGGWRGGYADGDSWRLNSGITKVVENSQDPNILEFHGYTGSIYYCHKESYGVGGYRAMVLTNQIANADKLQGEGSMTIMPEDTDWIKFNYNS